MVVSLIVCCGSLFCRAKLSDMGLSKRLAGEQLSFESVGSGGSSGWQAPEQLISRSGGTARQTNSGECCTCKAGTRACSGNEGCCCPLRSRGPP